MPIDPNIALGVKPIQLADPVEQAGRAMTLRQLAGNQQLQQMQLDAARRELADENAQNDAFRQYREAVQGGNAGAKLSDFAPSAKSAMKFQEFEAKQGKARTDAKKSEYEAQLKGIEFIRERATMATDQASWDEVRASLGPIGQSLPAQFSPELKRTIITKADDAAKQIIPKIQAFNTGKKTVFVDTNPNTNPTIGNTRLAMTTTPGQDVEHADRIRGQDKVDARAKDTAKRGRIQYDAERGGMVNLDTGEFRPVTQGGQPVGPKPDAAARKEVRDIDAQVNTINGALQAVQKTPTAFSMTRGAVQAAGSVPEAMAQAAATPDERAARAMVYNVVSKVINERAGAAQSAQELARLRGFLPSEFDNAEVIRDKLTGFQAYLADQRKAYDGTSAPAQTTAAAPVAAPARPAPPKLGEIRDGYAFQGGDPANPSNWKKR